MPRDISVEMMAALEEKTVRPILFFEGEFTSGTVRVWSGMGDLSWDGKTWIGVGSLGAIEPIRETFDTVAQGISVTLSGIPSTTISLVFGEARQGRSGQVWLGCLEDNVDGGFDVVTDPTLAFKGRLDVPAIEESGETCTVSISYESPLIDLERARERRYTDADQKIEYPDDRGFEYVPGLQEWAGVWGRS